MATLRKRTKQKSVEDANVQFITSSFQPELAQAADSHWLTTHSGMSRIVKMFFDLTHEIDHASFLITDFLFSDYAICERLHEVCHLFRIVVD